MFLSYYVANITLCYTYIPIPTNKRFYIFSKIIIFFLRQKKPDWSKKGDEKKVKEEVEYEA